MGASDSPTPTNSHRQQQQGRLAHHIRQSGTTAVPHRRVGSSRSWFGRSQCPLACGPSSEIVKKDGIRGCGQYGARTSQSAGDRSGALVRPPWACRGVLAGADAGCRSSVSAFISPCDNKTPKAHVPVSTALWKHALLGEMVMTNEVETSMGKSDYTERGASGGRIITPARRPLLQPLHQHPCRGTPGFLPRPLHSLPLPPPGCRGFFRPPWQPHSSSGQGRHRRRRHGSLDHTDHRRLCLPVRERYPVLALHFAAVRLDAASVEAASGAANTETERGPSWTFVDAGAACPSPDCIVCLVVDASCFLGNQRASSVCHNMASPAVAGVKRSYATMALSWGHPPDSRPESRPPTRAFAPAEGTDPIYLPSFHTTPAFSAGPAPGGKTHQHSPCPLRPAVSGPPQLTTHTRVSLGVSIATAQKPHLIGCLLRCRRIHHPRRHPRCGQDDPGRHRFVRHEPQGRRPRNGISRGDRLL